MNRVIVGLLLLAVILMVGLAAVRIGAATLSRASTVQHVPTFSSSKEMTNSADYVFFNVTCGDEGGGSKPGSTYHY